MSPRLRELTISYRVREPAIHIDASKITSAAAAAAVLVPVLEQQPVETFVVLHLNSKLQVIGLQEIARGGLDECYVHVRPILVGCLGSRNSRAIILGHNHPSGDPEPSPHDLALTRQIVHACRLVEIDVCDHIIVGDQKYVSLKESGRWEYL